MTAFTIRPVGATHTDIDAIAGILSESQRVLDPAFLAADRPDHDDWAGRVNDPQTEWALALTPDRLPAGFAGWRYLPGTSHLHALFVADAYQRQGYARALLAHHWRTVMRRQPETQIFTLHVRKPAYWARALYERRGYRYYQAGDEEKWPALATWIDFRRSLGWWPLEDDKLLMFQPASCARHSREDGNPGDTMAPRAHGRR